MTAAAPVMAPDPNVGMTIAAPAGFIPSQAIYCADANGKATVCAFSGSSGTGGLTGTVVASGDQSWIVGQAYALPFKPEIDVLKQWSFAYKLPGQSVAFPNAINVMTDLAMAMKFNPTLKVMVAGGYYNLATYYFESKYEMH